MPGSQCSRCRPRSVAQDVGGDYPSWPTYRFRLNSFLPMPCASYRCNSAFRIRTVPSRTTATPLMFLPMSPPYSRRSLGMSRILLPTAIGSTCVISPTISKGIDGIMAWSRSALRAARGWAEIVVNEAVAHTSHGPPLDGRILCTKLVRNFLRRLSNDLQTPDKRSPKRLVGQELLDAQTSTLANQVVCLDQDVAKIITRLEGHPPLPPKFAAQRKEKAPPPSRARRGDRDELRATRTTQKSGRKSWRQEELNQKINVAVGAGFAAHDGTEQREALDTEGADLPLRCEQTPNDLLSGKRGHPHRPI